MKISSLLLIFLLTTVSFTIAQNLEVSSDQTHLETADGKPFIWIGDTAWELFHKLDREEATEYLENRAQKDFSIIQAVVLAENDGLRTPNVYGATPLHDLDPNKPNEAYFEHVDFIVNKAEELGLYIGMLPTWGDKVYSVNPGAGPIVFNSTNAATFGAFLGKRYKDKPIVWILGGDRNIDNDEVFEIWRAMAKGIKEGDGGKNLITFHPRGASKSSYWLHNEDWLDFNMYQSGHSNHFTPVYQYAEDLTLLKPRKPFVDGEPAYEDISVKFWEFMDFQKYSRDRVPKGILDEDGLISKRAHFEKGFFTDYDVRIHGYWNFLAGACGYTYGNNAIWQMFKLGGEIAIPCLTDWRTAMDRPGGEDMKHLRALFESRPFNQLVPDQSIIFGLNQEKEDHIKAAGTKDNSYLIVYLAKGQTVRIIMSKVDGPAVAWWYNPRNGKTTSIGDFDNTGIQTFTPPKTATDEGLDWVLVIDQKDKKYPAPGVWK